jgi:hypothetical protein
VEHSLKLELGRRESKKCASEESRVSKKLHSRKLLPHTMKSDDLKTGQMHNTITNISVAQRETSRLSISVDVASVREIPCSYIGEYNMEILPILLRCHMFSTI